MNSNSHTRDEFLEKNKHLWQKSEDERLRRNMNLSDSDKVKILLRNFQLNRLLKEVRIVHQQTNAEFNNDPFIHLWEILNKHGVQFLVTGELSSRLHGVSIFMPVFSIWVEDGADNLQRLSAAFSKLDIKPFESVSPGVIQACMLKDVGELEIERSVIGLEEVTFNECYNAASIAGWGNVELKFLGLDHLIIHKRAAYGFKNQLDLKELQEIKSNWADQ